jgi:hypothetical protein
MTYANEKTETIKSQTERYLESRFNFNTSLLLNYLHIVLFLYIKLAIVSAKRCSIAMAATTYLPLVQLILFRLVLLDQVFEHLFQALLVRLKSRDHVFDCPLDQDAVDKAEALAVVCQWYQSFQHQPENPG